MASNFQHFMAWARRKLGYWNDDRSMEHEGKAEQVAIAFEEADSPEADSPEVGSAADIGPGKPASQGE